MNKIIFVILTFFTLLILPTTSLSQDEVDEKSTEINVKDADIAAVIRIFSKKTKRNYLMDEKVKGKVSIYLPGKVSEEEADRILDAVLAIKGFTAVPIGDNLWKIVPSGEAKQTTIPTIKKTDGRGSPSIVTRVLNLTYVAADEVKQLIQPLVSKDGLLNAYTGTNSLILIDHEENIKRLEEIIESFDIPYTNREMTIIPIEYAEAPDVADKINQILSENNDSSSQSGNQGLLNARATLNANVAARSNSQAGKASAGGIGSSSLTVSARSRAPKIIADERTNSIILVADEDTTARIRALVSELDSQIDRSGSKFYVYRCQHADAEDLADVLSGLSGEGGSVGSRNNASSFAGRGLNTPSGRNNSNNRNSRSQNRLSSQSRTPGRSRTSNSNTGNLSANLGEDISITADPSTNSLIINASKTDYAKILSLLKKLDIKRRQVLVQAVILEVGVNDTVDYNTEFTASGGGSDGGIFAANGGGSLTQLLSNPTALDRFTVAAASQGVLTLPGNLVIPSQTVLLQAAQTASNVNVLSAPNILATDNEEAEIVVGQNVPFLASTASNSQNLNNTFNQIDRQDVGITLRITPQISSSDFVTLRMFTEVSSVVTGTSGSDLGPTTTIRTSDTTAIAKDSQMIVVGGLMADDITESESGIPFIKDVPFIGHFFQSKTEVQRRTNLLIFLTPTIIRDQFDHRDLTLEHRDVLQKDIDNYKIYPTRKEKLYHKDLHSVIEGKPYSGPVPGTILPPIKSRTKNTNSMSKEKDSLALNSPLANSDTRQFSVKPKLPEVPNKNFRSNNEIDPVASTLLGKTQKSNFGKFVVLETDNLSSGTPLTIDPDSKLTMIQIPKNVPSEVNSFFRSGETYSYNTGDHNNLGLKVMGIFNSAEEASSFYSDLPNNWHTLSSFESLNIGKSPWIKTKK